MVNSSPINGTFQNFYPVRCWLNGQVSTRDFATYLGFGHHILGSIMTWIFGEMIMNMVKKDTLKSISKV